MGQGCMWQVWGKDIEQVMDQCISYGNVWGKDGTGGPVHIIW